MLHTSYVIPTILVCLLFIAFPSLLSSSISVTFYTCFYHFFLVPRAPHNKLQAAEGCGQLISGTGSTTA